MKKLKFVLYASCLLMSFSCQKPKDWECSCDCTPIGGSTSTKTTAITNAKQSEANSRCSEYGKAQVGGNGTWKCTIK